jgi:hypothetical protein
MSTMLATTNPAAADSVSPATAPGVGGMVVFIPRPGEQRMGRNAFPATVLFKHNDEVLDLLVLYGADDQGDRLRVHAWREDEPYNCWRHVQGAEPEKFEPSRLNKIREDLNTVQAHLQTMKEQVFGSWKAPDKPLIEFLVEFEKDLRDFRKQLQAKKKE